MTATTTTASKLANVSSGINAFVYYAPILFTNLGQEYETSLILSGMINVGQFVGVVPAMLYIDKLGRRGLAIWGAVGMCVSHAIMAGIYGAYGKSWSEHAGAGWACVAFVCKCSMRDLSGDTRTVIVRLTIKSLDDRPVCHYLWAILWSSDLDTAVRGI